MTDITDFCNNPPIVTPNGGTPPTTGGGSGDAGIDDGDDPNTTGSNTNAFEFRASFENISQNPSNIIAGCTWYWGDGSQTDYPRSQCEYGDWVNHTYPDNRQEIINSNGSQGCRRYTVRLVMRFTAASGLRDEEDQFSVYLPRGAANDNPDGICHGNYRTYNP